MHYFGLQRGSVLAFPLCGSFFTVLVSPVDVCLFVCLFKVPSRVKRLKRCCLSALTQLSEGASNTPASWYYLFLMFSSFYLQFLLSHYKIHLVGLK